MPACKTVGLAELNQAQIYIFKTALCFYRINPSSLSAQAQKEAKSANSRTHLK